MGKSRVSIGLVWIVIGIVGIWCIGCKPGRPQFALPKIKMVTGENLYSVVAFSPKELMLFGNHGTVYFTTTGGGSVEEWKPLESGIEGLLMGEATFVDRLTGWVVGVKGTIIHTVDGGEKWSTQVSGTERALFSVSFADKSNGWVVGEFGTILHTSNGGEHWESQAKEVDKMLNSVYFVDGQNGWVVGEFGTILHTTDGGLQWEQQRCEDIETKVGMDSYDWKPAPALYEVRFKDLNSGWIVGMDGVILRTDDGGIRWRRLETKCDIPLYGIEIKGTKGWVVGNRGYYLSSLDGGETWEVKDGLIKTRFWLRDVTFSDERNGCIIGAMGTIARTADGGATWELISGMSYDMPEYGLSDF